MSPPDWLDPDQPYLLAISGGRDSVFLYHWLTEHGFRSLIPCHLNHVLRGAESDGDVVFLRNLCGETLLSERSEVAQRAEFEKLSFETAAREARHDFFKKCAERMGVHEVLLAHHADDQAETLLFNLLRGSAGAKGMLPEQKIGDLTFLRPMLCLRRTEIDNYLAHRQIGYREDSTNALPFAARNRLRNEAFPLLREIMKRDPVPALLRAHQQTLELEGFVETSLQKLDLEDPQGRLFLPKIRELHPVLQRQGLFAYLKKHKIPDLSSALIERSLSLLQPSAPPSINLPGGRRLRRKESRLFIAL